MEVTLSDNGDILKKISFRISDQYKDYITQKSDILNISTSDLIRTLIEHDKVLNLELNNLNNVKNITGKFNNEISFKINSERYKYLKSLSVKLNVTLSVILRLIIANDQTEIFETEYLNECLKQLYPFSVLINNIAHQLNSDSFTAVINIQSYMVAYSRLGMAQRLSDNILSLFKYYPEVCNVDNLLIKKNDLRIWIGKLHKIDNNINQISKRLNYDLYDGIINIETFNQVSDRLENISNNLNQYYLYVKMIVEG